MQKKMLRAKWLEKCSAEKDLRFLVDRKVNMSKQGVLTAKKANSLTGCIRRTIASR